MADGRLAILGGHRAVTVAVTAAPVIGDGEVQAVVAALQRARSGDPLLLSALAGAGFVEKLERRFQSYLGVRYALALSSGTAALHAALVACGIRRGQEVILSAYDWGAGVAAVLAVGARPVFADIDPFTYTLDPSSAIECVTGRTSAILVTHIFGHPADMEALCQIARSRGLRLIEDCAQALGATYRGRPVGTFGDAGCFSLGPGKLVTGGEGGVLVTGSDDVFERAVRFCQHPLRQLREGLQPNPFALNYRIHPLAALIARLQFDHLDDSLDRRRAQMERLSGLLRQVPGIGPVFVAPGCSHSFYRYSPTYVPAEWDGLPRAMVVAALAAEGVPITDGFIQTPLSALSVLRRGRGRSTWAGACPITEERCASQELGLDCPALAGPEFEDWLGQVALAVDKVYRQRHLLLKQSLSATAQLKRGTGS